MRLLLENNFQSIISRHKNLLPANPQASLTDLNTGMRKILITEDLEHLYKEAQMTGQLAFCSEEEGIQLGVIDTNQHLLKYNLTDRKNLIWQKIQQDDSIQKVTIDLREELVAGLQVTNGVDTLKTWLTFYIMA